MGVYSDIVIRCSNEEKEAMAFMNEWAREDVGWDLFYRMVPPAEGIQMPNGVYVAWCKNFPDTDFREAMHEAPWKRPGQVICIITEDTADQISIFMPFKDKYLENYYTQYRDDYLEKLHNFD